MDPAYEAEILRAFAVFVERGLVYESMKPVFWSTGAQTALAEAEVEYQERQDTAVYVKFPIVTGPLAGQAASSFGPRRHGLCRRISRLRSIQKSATSRRNSRDGENTETLVLAEKLLPQFCAATGFSIAGSVTPGANLA